MEKRKSGRILTAVNFMILMAALGASDSLRGIFAPAFQEHFSLSGMELSVIIMVSYMGNLVFLCLGGKALDKYNRKRAAMGVTVIWMAALLLYIFTDNYYCLLVGMFFAMGTSTLLNTAINILTPTIFATAPGMMVNIFFFVQGIGTSGSQKLAGTVAESYGAFKLVNLILAAMGLVSLLLLWRADIPDVRESRREEHSAGTAFLDAVKQNGFWLLVLIFGLYFIGEHGIMNWLVSYGTHALGLEVSRAATCLSGFYGGITIGRLLLAPVVAKAGAFRSIRLFGGVGTVLFVAGLLTGGRGLWLLSLSGLAVSIVYPTLVYLVRYIYPVQMLGVGLGAVISTATLFDIGFNVLFGRMIDVAGYQTSFLVIPLCMTGFYICYLIFAGKYGRREEISNHS